MAEYAPEFNINLIKEKPNTSIDIERYNNNLCEIAKEIIQVENNIGTGNSADVFKDPIKTNNLCYKFMTRQEPMDHDPEDEASFMIELEDIHSNVRVPSPIASIMVRKVFDEKTKRLVTRKVLVMERIDGYSLKEMYDNPNLIPKTYNHEEFFKNLESFVKSMHEKGIHHRDLHLGNVMCEIETGNPIVIDFGRSTRATSEESPYKEVYLILDKVSNKFKEDIVTFTSDLDYLRQNKKMMEEKL